MDLPGRYVFRSGRLSHARAAYERSILAYPQGRLVDRASYGLGRTLAELGERDRAVTYCKSSPEERSRVGRPSLAPDRFDPEIGRKREAAIEAFTALEQAALGAGCARRARLERGVALGRLDRHAARPSRFCGGWPMTPRSLWAPGLPLSLQPSSSSTILPAEPCSLSNRPSSGFPRRRSCLCWFRSAEALSSKTIRPRPRRGSSGSPNAAPKIRGPTTPSQRAAQSALDRATRPPPGALPAALQPGIPAVRFDNEARLIEARAASMAGKPKDSAAILETLLVPPSETSKASAPPPLAPTLALAARYDLALAYRALGRSAQADALLVKLASDSAGPVTADAQFLLGQATSTLGDMRRQSRRLEQYVAANPQGDVADFALAHLAMARLGLGQLDGAWKTLPASPNRFPRSKALTPTRLRLAEAALAAHQAGRAAEQFRLVARPETASDNLAKPSAGKPGDATDPSLRMRALVGLGKALWELGKPADAAAAFATALELAPSGPLVPEIALAHGRALEASHQSDAALKAYSLVSERFAKSDLAPQAGLAHARLVGKAGRHEDAALVIRTLDRRSGRTRFPQSRRQSLDALLAEWGWSLIYAGKPAEADRVFGRLLKDYPESPFAADARFNLAESANLAHDYVRGRPFCSTPSQPPRRQSRARPATHRGPIRQRPSSNGIPMRRPIRSGACFRAVLYRLGRSQVELKDWPAAGSALDRLLGEFPDSPYRREATFLREAALQGGDAAAARLDSRHLKEPAASTDPKGWIPAVRFKQIQCWVALKRWKQALEGAEQLKTGLSPDDPAIPELDFATGQGLLGVARLDEARAAFQRVIGRGGKSDLAAQALLMHGETHFHQDHFHEALRDFLQVDILYKSPRWQAAALMEAGKVYERLDQWADAAESYERLLTRFPMSRSPRRPGFAVQPPVFARPQLFLQERVSALGILVFLRDRTGGFPATELTGSGSRVDWEPLPFLSRLPIHREGPHPCRRCHWTALAIAPFLIGGVLVLPAASLAAAADAPSPAEHSHSGSGHDDSRAAAMSEPGFTGRTGGEVELCSWNGPADPGNGSSPGTHARRRPTE